MMSFFYSTSTNNKNNRVFVLAIGLASIVVVVTTTWSSLAFASPSSSPSPVESQSWWEGMKFQDGTQTIDQPTATTPTTFSTERPKIQIPCCLILGKKEEETTDGKISTTTASTTNDDNANVLPLSTIIDTSQSVSTLDARALQRYPELQPLVVRVPNNVQHHNYQQQSSVYSYYIPSGTLQLRMGSIEATTVAPTLRIVAAEPLDQQKTGENNNNNNNGAFELKLGMDFLWDHLAIVNLEQEQIELQLPKAIMTDNNHENDGIVTVPLIRPRSRPLFLETEENDHEL